MSELTLDRKSWDTLCESVKTLTEAVRRQQAGQLDEEAVARIAADVMQGRRQAAPRRRSLTPHTNPGAFDEGDLIQGFALPQTIFDLGRPDPEKVAGRGRDRVYELHGAYPGKVAEAIGLPESAVREWQVATDTLILASQYLEKAPDELAFFDNAYRPLTQAMDTGTAGEGIEFVPKELSGSMIERINLELLVAALFPVVAMPTQPFEIPGFAVSRQRTGTHPEQTADTGQTKVKKVTPQSRKIVLTAIKLAVEALTSKELEEDSIIAVLPMMQSEIVDFLAADWEDTIVNGDTTATHQDSDTTAADDPRKGTNGLRKLTPAAAKTDVANAVLTSAMLRTNRQKMGRYGIRARDLAHIVAMRSYISLLGDPNVVTIDKYGPNATVLTGELGKVDGVPIVVSEFVRQDLNATGVHDGVTTNRTIALTANRRGFLQGERRGITVQVLRELYAESDQDAVIASFRRAFAPRFPSTETTVALSFNVA
jgi:Phage capsid family